MDYTGKPNHPMPSKRYDLYIKHYEKKVTEAQKMIEQTARLAPFYNICRDALNKNEHFPNDIKLDTKYNGVYVEIGLTEENHYLDFAPIVQDIQRLLVKKGYRDKGHGPSLSDLNCYWIYWKWILQRDSKVIGEINVKLDIPYDGTKYCHIQKESYIRNETRSLFIWSEHPNREKFNIIDDAIPF